MQERNKTLGMLKNLQFGWDIFTLRLEAYIIVEFKKLVSDISHAGSALIEADSREKRGNQNSPKYNNSLKTFPCAILKHLAMHQSEFILKISSQKSVRPI